MNHEKVEWINSILSDLWPYLCIHIKNILKDQIQPMINEMEPNNILKTFQFTDIHIGSLAPRIKHMNAYRPKQFNLGFKNRARSIILDLEIDFCGDTDIRFKCLMMPLGISDVIFKGYARVELSPLLTMPPFFGSVAVSFTEIPVIDFDLTGVGNLVELPFLNTILHNTVDRIVADKFVLPAKFIVPMISVENMASVNLKPMDIMHPFAKGCMFLHIKKASNLVAKDNVKALGVKLLQGKSDPFMVVNLGNQEYKTKIVKQELSPIWDEKCCLLVSNPSTQTIKINVWDDDSDTPISPYAPVPMMNQPDHWSF